MERKWKRNHLRQVETSPLQHSNTGKGSKTNKQANHCNKKPFYCSRALLLAALMLDQLLVHLPLADHRLSSCWMLQWSQKCHWITGPSSPCALTNVFGKQWKWSQISNFNQDEQFSVMCLHWNYQLSLKTHFCLCPNIRDSSSLFWGVVCSSMYFRPLG